MQTGTFWTWSFSIWIRSAFTFTCFILLTPVASAATITWIGANGSWDTASNWSPAQVPGVLDDAIINVPSTVVVTLGSDTVVGSITLGCSACAGQQTLDFAGRTLTLSGPNPSTSTANGRLLMNTGVLTVDTASSFSGPFDWNGGWINGTATATFTGSVTIGDTNWKYVDGTTLSLQGTTTYAANTYYLTVTNTGVIDNGGVFNYTGSERIASTGTTPNVFRNSGTVTKTGGAGVLIYPLFDNTSAATLDVQGGELDLVVGGTNNGIFSVAAGAVLDVPGGSNYTLGAGAVVSGAGVLTLTGGTLDATAPVTITNLTLFSGILSATTGSYTVTGAINWNGGYIRGATTFTSTSTVTFGDTTWKYIDGATVSFQGATDYASTSYYLTIQNGGVLDNSGTFTISGSQIIYAQGGGPRLFTNTGTVRKIGPALVEIDSLFDNNGNVDVVEGTLRLDGGGTSSGTFSVAAPGALGFHAGTHVVDALTSVSGTGTVSVTGGASTFAGVFSTNALSVSSGTAFFDSAATVNDFTFSGGILNGTGSLSVTANGIWNGGRFRVATTFGPTSVVTIGNTTWKYIDATTVSFQGITDYATTANYLSVQNLGVLDNSGSFTISGDERIASSGTAPNLFRNSGTVTKTGTALVWIQTPFDNTSTGTLDVQQGELEFHGGGTNNGTFSIAAAAVLDFPVSSYTLGLGTIISGAGHLSVTGGTLDAATSVTLPNLSFSSGILTASSGSYTVTGNANWDGGRIRGLTTFAPTSTVTFGDTTWKYIDGTTVWFQGATDYASTSYYLTIQNGGVLDNSGSFTISGDRLIASGGTTPNVFQSSGTVEKSGPAFVEIDSQFDNTGTLNVLDGTLRLDGGGTSSGTHTITSPGILGFGGGTHIIDGLSSVSGTGEVSISGGVATFAGTFTPNDLSVSNGTVNFASPANVTTLSFTGGVIAGTSSLAVDGTANWDGGRFQVPTTFGPASNVTLGNTTWKYIDGTTVSFQGTTDYATTANYLTVRNLGVLDNSGSFIISGDQRIASGGTTPNFFQNSGTVTKTGTALIFIDTRFDNTVSSATLDIQGGEIEFLDGGTNNGTLSIATGAVLDVPVATYTLGPGSVINGGGVLTVTGGTLDAVVAVTIPNLTLSTGNLTASGGSFTVTGVANWEGGFIRGDTTFAPTSSVTLTDTSWKYIDGATVTFQGVTDYASTTYYLTVTNQGVLDNSGTFTISGNQIIASTGALPNLIQNSGNLTKTGAALIRIHPTFDNTGAVEVQGGTLSFEAPFTQTSGSMLLNGGDVAATSTFTIDGGALGGTGTITTATVSNNAGSFQPGLSAGTLTISGDYQQGPGASLDLELGGVTAGTYDRLAISGQASLSGTLNVALIAPYYPLDASAHQVLTFGSRAVSPNDDFTVKNGLVLANGDQLFLRYDLASPSTFLDLVMNGNAIPIAAADTATTDEESPIIIDVLANDSDPDGDPITITSATQPVNGSVDCSSGADCTYTPDVNFNGPDSFTYTISDGFLSSTGSVDVTVNPVNDAPVAVNDPDGSSSSLYTTAEDVPLIVAAPGVLQNDIDIDGDPLTAAVGTGPANGTLTLNADGSLTYTPNTNFNGTDSFTYTANDGLLDSNAATVTITVSPVNDPPFATADAYSVNEDQTLTVTAPGVLGNDPDPEGDPLTATLSAVPLSGTASVSLDGSFTYTPNANFNGTDSFSYTASDGQLVSNAATVTITVGGVNDNPVANDDPAAVTNEDTPVTIDVLANDSDLDGDILSVSGASNGANGNVSCTTTDCTYTPNVNFNGTDSFSYTADDGNGGSDSATVTVTVNPINDAPTAANDSYSGTEDLPLTVTTPGVLANDSDVDGDPLAAALSATPSSGSVVLNSNGSFTYTPNPNFNGTDSFSYTATDGQLNSNIAVVTLTIGAQNDPPVANDDTYAVPEDSQLVVSAPGVLINDNDLDGDSLTSSLVTSVSNGSLSFQADGSFTYTPTPDFDGIDSFTYTTSDGQLTSTVATVTIDVLAMNDPPVAVDDTATTIEDTPVVVSVLANDSDPDGDMISVSAVTQGTNGSVTCSTTTCTYTPAPGFRGTDSFSYTIADTSNATDTAAVTITVTRRISADVSVTKTGPGTVAQDTSVTFQVTVTNNGPDTAANVVVVDPTPLGTTFISNNGACTTAYPCSVGSLAAGESRVIDSAYAVSLSATGTVTNQASVSADTLDTDLSNNSATITPTVCPASPRRLHPSRGIEAPTKGTLSWLGTGADSYTVDLGKARSTLTRLGRTTQNTFDYSGLEPATEYEWRVTALKNGCASSSATARFVTRPDTCPSSQPELLSPAEGVEISGPILFSWTPVSGAVAYRLYAAVDDGEMTMQAETTGEASTAAEVAIGPGVIAWRVEALLEGGCPPVSSETSVFSVLGAAECSEEAPAILSPVSGSVSLGSPVTFSWTTVPGAKRYRVWIQLDGDQPVIVGETVSTSLTTPLPSGVMTWFVQVLLDGCPPNISDVAEIAVEPAADCPLEAPALLSPLEETVQGDVTFRWSPVESEEVIQYVVWASIEGDTESVIGETGPDQTELKATLDAGEIEWWVQVFYEACPPVNSRTGQFLHEEIVVCPSGVAIPLTPSDGADGVDPLVRFTWTEVEGADGYRLHARTNRAGEFDVIGATLAETGLQLPLDGTFIEWQVETVFIGCPPSLSEIRSFDIETRSCSTNATTPLAPSNDARLQEERVTFRWSLVDNAVAYEVWVVRGNGVPAKVAVTDGMTTEVDVDLQEGEQHWWVTTVFGGDCSRTKSSQGRFSIDIPDPQECDPRGDLLLISPREGKNDIVSPAILEWTRVPGAEGYQVYTLQSSQSPQKLGGVRSGNQAVVQLPAGLYRWFVVALRPDCPNVQSQIQHFRVVEPVGECETPARPRLSGPGKVTSGTKYLMSWQQVQGATNYEIQRSPTESFRGAPVRVVRGTSTSYEAAIARDSQALYHRVRAVADCDGVRGSYSIPARVLVEGSDAQNTSSVWIAAGEADGFASIELNKDAFSQQEVEVFTVTLRSRGGEETVRIVPDQAWLTVVPETVTLTEAGVEVEIRADMAELPLGSHQATFTMTPTSSSALSSASASQSSSVSTTVTLVTPVSSSGKNEPLPQSLIVPAVAHAEGLDSTWLSDVRLSNVGATAQKYQLNFTPSASDATVKGQTTTIDVAAGEVVALNDLLSNWFGTSAEGATGTLEIRPLKTTTSSSIGGLGTTASSGSASSIASSRTYAITPTGTFGQFIPAVRFEEFVGLATESTPSVLSMQQISESVAYRTNLGIVEASGNPTTANVTVYAPSGLQLTQFEVALAAGEHKQLNGVLQQHGLTLEDGRITVSAGEGRGKLMAYASVVDNLTGDPQLVPAQRLDRTSGRKLVISGVADLEVADASWRTDARVLNAGTSTESVRLTFYPQGNPSASMVSDITIEPGEIWIADDMLRTLFGVSNSGGAVHLETEEDSTLVATARTYDRRVDGGTYGQFISAQRAETGVSPGDRSLQLLQVEQSERFRTNLGLTEVAGAPVMVEITATVPGSLVAPKVRVSLEPNEFVQFNSVLESMGLSSAYNARLTVRAVEGSGSVLAYASIIDRETQDPTYVPAQ